MAERTTVRLPQELLRRGKRRASAEGRSLTALIEDGLRRVLSEGSPAPSGSRIPPPVSSMTGGLMPGVDLNETAALQEMEDLNQADRLV